MARLENWFVTKKYPSEYAAPEQGYIVLCGIVYEHPEIKDGSPITTTRLEMLYPDGCIAKTKNTSYTLGQPDDDWVEYLHQNGHKVSDYALDEIDSVAC